MELTSTKGIIQESETACAAVSREHENSPLAAMAVIALQTSVVKRSPRNLCKGVLANDGYRKFLGKEGTGVWNYKSLPNIISCIDDFMYELDDNCPIYLSVGISSTASSDGYMKHSAMAFCYAQSTFPERNLFVMDGLKNYGWFVSKGYYDFFQDTKFGWRNSNA